MKPEPIWYPGSPAPYVFIEQRLSLAGEIAEGWLKCAARGPYHLWVNGQLAGRGLGGTLTQEPMWERFGLREWLQAGENTLTILAAGDREPAWFSAQGQIVYGGGNRVELATGTPWQVGRAIGWEAGDSPRWSEIYRAAGAGPQEWQEAVGVPGAPDPGEWSPWPATVQEVWAREVAAFGEIDSTEEGLRFVEQAGPLRQCKCVHREGLLRPGKIWTLVQTRAPERAVFLVLDFGRQVIGFPRLRLRGGAGGLIELGFARAWGQVESGLRYGCRAGVQEWTGLRLRTCRYVVARLSHFQEEVEIDWIGMAQRRVEVEGRGEFAAGPLLGQIWEVGQLTLAACRQETYYFPGMAACDWLLAYALSLDDYYLTGDTRTAGALLASARPREGQLPQALAYLLFLDSYYRYGGERAQVAGLLARALESLEAGGGQVAPTGLPAEEEGWPSTALMALYAGALEAAGRLCRRVGEKAAAIRCEREFKRARRGVQQAWDSARGVFADRPGGEAASQWSNALALYFGLADERQEEEVARRIAGPELLPVKALAEAFFLEGGLWRAGQGDRALEYLEAQWGRLAERPGQTWGEKSLGQEVLPGPEYYLGAQVIGVRPAAPGYQILEVRPPRLGLRQARGKVGTRRGMVEVGWVQEEGGGFSVEVGLEAEGETRVWVPRLGRRFPTVSLNGETLWRNEKFYPNPFVRQVIAEEEHVVLVLHGSGEYRAVVE